MNLTWDKWLEEAVDWMDCRYNLIKETNSDSWERAARRAWASQQDPYQFADDWVRSMAEWRRP